ETIRRGGTEIVNQHVGTFHKPQQGLFGRGNLEVEDKASFVAVASQVERAHLLADPRPDMAIAVAGWRFDLDYVPAEIAEDLAGQRSEDHARQVQHANAVEGPGHEGSEEYGKAGSEGPLG